MDPVLALLLIALAPVAADDCRVLVTAKDPGEEIAEAQTREAPCPDAQPPVKVRLATRTRTLHARVALAAGEPLGRVYFPARPTVARGEPVVLTVRVGGVTISRPATALQAGEPGRRFFVRLDDGKVIAAPPLANAR